MGRVRLLGKRYAVGVRALPRRLLPGLLLPGLLLTGVPGGSAAESSGVASATTQASDAPSRLHLRPVDRAGLREVVQPLRDGTTRLETTAYSLVAVTWRGERTPTVAIRVHGRDRWQGWRRLEPLEDLGESSRVHGTEPLWVGLADGIQVRVTGAADDVELVLIDPGSDPASGPATTAASGKPRGAAAKKRATPKVAPRPDLHRRDNWGANERWRSTGPKYNRTIQQVHLHHTATANDYKRGEVRGILRSIYRYHTKSLRWSDIGYNFLVDRFGRIWEGRAGGPGRPVRGAHTLGFNSTSTGIAVIGNFEQKAPRDEVVTALVRLAAWKLDAYGRNPRGRVTVYSHGSDRYPAGRRVRLRVIDGHRDTNDTACPGQLLYDLLPTIRDRARHRVDRFS